MQLTSSDGRSLSLHIVGYEFPDEDLSPNDDNPADDFDRGRFLVVGISLHAPEDDWHATAPEMTTTELERLANWLESITHGQPTSLSVYFTERDLEFTLDSETRTLNIHLAYDFLPPWETQHVHTISICNDPTTLSAAAASIRSQLALFPHRPMPH